ncbi:MAG: polysaccharide deacetylase family protein [Oscillospiraceae bacterium]|jgi:polysaccharide deacetylase family sporulation protein PdaB|nr:polysaccharide deacetylase family protein [Oscillospiraceae bacterium]
MALLQRLRAWRPRPGNGRAVALALLLALSACYCGMQPGGDMMVLSRTRELPIYSVKREDKVIAISFDAAWGGSQTLALLDILDEYQVKTTFFLVGIWVERYPELVKEIIARGHELGNHSTSHPQMTKISQEKMREELKKTSDRIEELTGVRPVLFRPPYGDYNDAVVSVSRAEGYECVQWSVDSLDWKNRGVEDLVRQATKAYAPGDIVLFHNDSQYIVQALPAILKHYQAAGYQVVPVSQILLDGTTEIDHTGRQYPVTKAETENKTL